MNKVEGITLEPKKEGKSNYDNPLNNPEETQNRREKIENIQRSVYSQVEEEEKKARQKRRDLLGLKDGEEVECLEYSFKLPFEPDEEVVEKILENIGEREYRDKEERWGINDYNTWTSWVKKLVWPNHYASFVDSISVSSRREVDVTFVRGENNSNREELEERANSIYKEIETKSI